ncbi:hypothetical protein OTU49_004952, partial [Cherax quadricarinatus]
KTPKISIERFFDTKCLKHNRLTVVLLLVFAIILITIAIGVIVAWQRIKRTTTIPSAASDYQSFTEPVPPSRAPSAWAIVQPDPRTYQETEIHILFDKAQEMDAYDRNSLPILE